MMQLRTKYNSSSLLSTDYWLASSGKPKTQCPVCGSEVPIIDINGQKRLRAHADPNTRQPNVCKGTWTKFL